MAINERVRSPDHLNVGVNLLNRSEGLRFRGECERARADYARARAIRTARMGPDAVDLLGIEAGAAECLRRIGKLPEARAAIDRAKALAKGGEAQPSTLAETRFIHAQILEDSREHEGGRRSDEAVRLAHEARDHYAAHAETGRSRRRGGGAAVARRACPGGASSVTRLRRTCPLWHRATVAVRRATHV